MRAAADDALRTFGARHLPAVVILIVIAADVMLSVSGNSSATVHMDNNAIVYKLRVVFLCDETSDEFLCRANLTFDELSQLFSESMDAESFQDCGGENSSGHSSTNVTCHSRHSSFDYYLNDNHIIVTKNVSETGFLSLDVTCHVISGNVRSKISDADALVTSEFADVIIAVGNFLTVQTAAIVAEGHLIPILGYITEYGTGPKVSEYHSIISFNNL